MRLNNEAYERRMTEKIEALACEVGEGAKGVMNTYQGYATLFLSEAAAERVLARCGANPLPDRSRPSTAKDSAEWSRRCFLLSKRVKRALGNGYPGRDAPNQVFQASIWVGSEPILNDLLWTLGAEEDISSDLGELLI